MHVFINMLIAVDSMWGRNVYSYVWCVIDEFGEFLLRSN